MAKSIKKIGIVIKQNVKEANELASQTADFLKKNKYAVAFASESQDVCELITGTTCETKEELVASCDLIIVFGGDGTFISVARMMVTRSVPMLGVNMGQLGFITEFSRENYMDGLQAALKGELVSSERTLLECTLQRGSKTVVSTPIVNDVVISKGEIARIFDVEITVDKHSVTKVRGDGLLISTPTGSTAYSLAAGGPIIQPDVPAMVISAICPHPITFRPLVINDSSEVILIPQFKKGGRVILTLDGQKSVDLELGDLIRVSRFKKHKLQILKAPSRDYFSVLREKLKYGYRE